MPLSSSPFLSASSFSSSVSAFNFNFCFSSGSQTDTNMDPSDNFQNTGNPTRRELQGPRPAPLKVRKDSHKIKKPPVAPQQVSHQHQPPPQPQHRPPVIIYTVSPKVIHTHPSEFMTLVQRLTGSSTSSSSSSSSSYASSPNYTNPKGAISPAARFATLEKANRSPERKKKQSGQQDYIGMMEGMEMDDDHDVVVERRAALFPGILSPGPGSLPSMIPPNFFSPQPSDPNSTHHTFFHDLISPLQQGNNNKPYIIEGSAFMHSPSPHFFSPTPSLDLFNNFLDF